MSDHWLKVRHWKNTRRATIRIGGAQMLHHGIIHFQEVVQALGNGGTHDARKVDACADLLRDVCVAKGWIPDGAQPVAMWVEPEMWDLCLMLTHSSFDPVEEGSRPPVFRPTWEPVDPEGEAARPR